MLSTPVGHVGWFVGRLGSCYHFAIVRFLARWLFYCLTQLKVTFVCICTAYLGRRLLSYRSGLSNSYVLSGVTEYKVVILKTIHNLKAESYALFGRDF